MDNDGKKKKQEKDYKKIFSNSRIEIDISM